MIMYFTLGESCDHTLLQLASIYMFWVPEEVGHGIYFLFVCEETHFNCNCTTLLQIKLLATTALLKSLLSTKGTLLYALRTYSSSVATI